MFMYYSLIFLNRIWYIDVGHSMILWRGHCPTEWNIIWPFCDKIWTAVFLKKTSEMLAFWLKLFLLLYTVIQKRKIRAMEESQKWCRTSLRSSIHWFASCCFGKFLPQLQPQYECVIMCSYENQGLLHKD